MKIIVITAIIAILAFATLSSSLVIRQENSDDIATIRKANADEAEKLQEEFASFTPDKDCQVNDLACINKDFAMCAPTIEDGKVVNKFVLFPCGTTLECFALPLVLKRGTSITCTTPKDREDRLFQARNNL
ncbi:uncharacterized protein OCT59_027467 [Rhizophagus irregularis]|uniref:Proline-rich protein n=3 Tax=Rhizophagus irregularis TaxID=588596 RepID=A0A015IAT7_RHIIW|nr:hypothetical protein GLOIN_2v1882092 [Rhizophagus irregularis DAOM 181602=DAOM 197198]EXX50925.1 hypothetical protein RirG_266320 [Rhizophagus irregularis DAOM 197198w]UZO07172.1 hypothetical protein OCT59_027467 [Rhizophagus irregularis]EXX74447.1 hypothetical protein RirG_051060 [Rhizophagus irregularis DAOM 197198w]POG63471.1 hypothetical protein GLOIN_2v1882092 [Rhizophagus irregularis DAOM 181602=DAOM 197198]CAB5211084.1 unnamed protein product [Rhizophagus irregularis]|eukprot:XP_025170337.1 hypothetical protein GLOIN_2v1882092 [Rhizophagus irregularis DAOM 181602=DAOM 197198]